MLHSSCSIPLSNRLPKNMDPNYIPRLQAGCCSCVRRASHLLANLVSAWTTHKDSCSPSLIAKLLFITTTTKELVYKAGDCSVVETAGKIYHNNHAVNLVILKINSILHCNNRLCYYSRHNDADNTGVQTAVLSLFNICLCHACILCAN
jgi:hypothetical protein